MAALSELSIIDGVATSYGGSATVEPETNKEYYIPAACSKVTMQAGLAAEGEYYLEICADPKATIEAGNGYWFNPYVSSLTTSKQCEIEAPVTAVRCRPVSGSIAFAVLARG